MELCALRSLPAGAAVALVLLTSRTAALDWMSSVAESSSAIELTNDGTLSSGVSDTGPAANAGACSERCFAEQQCGAYTWVSPEPADPELRPLAQHCVLVSSPAAAPRACGAGCGGQFSGRRVSSPWPSDGYDRLPTVWFSANATGPNSREMLDLIAKHDLAIVSWGQAMSSEPGRITRDSEKAQAEAATAVRSYLDSVGNNVTVLGVYRQIQIAVRSPLPHTRTPQSCATQHSATISGANLTRVHVNMGRHVSSGCSTSRMRLRWTRPVEPPVCPLLCI